MAGRTARERATHAAGSQGRLRWRRTARGKQALKAHEDDGYGPDGVDHLSAIFKVMATHTEPYYTMPWSMSPQSTSTASAFALNFAGSRYLLTNAHAVHHASVVELKKAGEDTRRIAKVVCEGPDCDLALLEVLEEEEEEEKEFTEQESTVRRSEYGASHFWEGVEPLELCGELPHLNDEVRVCGYPVGGDNACLTQGVVSRIDMQSYRHGHSSLLALQIDAAINPGNSGGPAIDSRRRCVGVAFQSLKDGDTENIGYLIPAAVVEHFLLGYQRYGRYTGFGHVGCSWQPLESRALREALGARAGGVLVRRVYPLAPAAKHLQPRDVLLAIDGHQIGSAGTVVFRGRERIAFPYVVTARRPGDELDIEILRDGKRRVERLQLTWHDPLVPMHPPQPPEYLVFGGMVFVPLSEPYLESEFGENFEDSAPVCFIEPWLRNVRATAGEEIVVLSCVLGSPLTAGLTHYENRRLLRCGGQQVLNLAHLATIIDTADGPSLFFELDDDELIALPLEEARAATAEVLKANMIPAARRLSSTLA